MAARLVAVGVGRAHHGGGAAEGGAAGVGRREAEAGEEAVVAARADGVAGEEVEGGGADGAGA
jgi:hypothetical protein